MFFFYVQATPRSCTSKQEKVQYLFSGRKGVFLFLCFCARKKSLWTHSRGMRCSFLVPAIDVDLILFPPEKHISSRQLVTPNTSQKNSNPHTMIVVNSSKLPHLLWLFLAIYGYAPTTHAGCPSENPATHTAGETWDEVVEDVLGVHRFSLPESYDPEEPMPLLLYFHGWGMFRCTLTPYALDFLSLI